METRETKAEHYERIAEYLCEQSNDICESNECNIEDDEHNCESYAYFDYDHEAHLYTLETVCLPDYCQRSYDIAIGLPFDDNGTGLLDMLDMLDMEDLN